MSAIIGVVLLALGSVPSTAQVDSIEFLEVGREAQRRFERLRQRYLPLTNREHGTMCDDRVGRMCWYHDTGGLWQQEPEDEQITAARGELLRDLAALAYEIPGDEWILGQRVYYLAEADRLDEALSLSRACPRAAASWCDALEGYLLHLEGRYAEAEAAFDRALAAMDPRRRDTWRDLTLLLDGKGRDLFEDGAPDGSASPARIRARFWQLADPLYLVEGNDRRSAHYSRRVVARIRERARNPHGISWGDDMEELLVRYGVPVGWEKVLPGAGQILSTVGTVGHEHPDSRSYIPPGEVLADPSGLEPNSWQPALAYSASAYAPRHAAVMLPFDGEVASFTRGDYALVVATFQLPEDTTLRARREVRQLHGRLPAFEDGAVRAGLFVIGSSDGVVRSAQRRGESEGALLLEVPIGSYWTSVEVWDPATGVAGRQRQGLEVRRHLPDVPLTSELLLLEEGPEPADLEEALSRWRLDARVRPGEAFLIGWEVWGLGWRRELISYRLSVRRLEGGFLRRAGRWLRLVGRGPSHVLEWDEPGPEEPGPSFRSISVELPSMDPGEYVLRLELVTTGRGTVVSERRLELVEF